jgi:hypothetical protein
VSTCPVDRENDDVSTALDTIGGRAASKQTYAALLAGSPDAFDAQLITWITEAYTLTSE